MSRIVICCLAALKDDEVRFLELVRDQLAARGHEFVLVSPIWYDSLAERTLPVPGDLHKWSATFMLDRVSAEDAVRPLDATVWLRRVQHIAGDSLGRVDCSALFESMARTSLAILEALQPGLFVGWNPVDPYTGLMYAIAASRGIPVSAFERGLLPSTMNVDGELGGISSSLAGKSWDDIQCPAEDGLSSSEVRKYLEQAFDRRFLRYAPGSKGDALDAIASGSWANSRPRIAVLGCFDTACGLSPEDPERLRSMPGYESGFDLACNVARSHPGVTVFKPHPCMEGRVNGYDVRPHRSLLVGTGDAREYLNWADVVVSYGTTLEYAALAADRPVVLAGRSSLFGKGIAYEALEPSQLPQTIEQAYRRVGFEERVKRFHAFVGYLLREYLIRVDTEEQRRCGAERWCEQLHRMARPGTLEKSFAQVRSDLLCDDELARCDRMAVMEKQIARQQEQIGRQQEETSQQQEQIAQQQRQITQQREQITQQQRQIAQHQEEIAKQQEKIGRQQEELDAIRQSRTWRLACSFRRLLK